MAKQMTRAQRNQMAFIGAALVAPEKAKDSICRLSPAMFEEGALRDIFTAIYQLTFAGAGLDPVTVAARAGDQYKRLILQAAETVPSISHIADYEALVVEDYRARLLTGELSALTYGLSSGETADAVCERLRTALRMQEAISNAQTDATARDFDATLDDVLADLAKPDTSLKTGWKKVDRYGMLERSNTVVIGGRPGCGKTDFAINLAGRLSGRYRVYYLTLEETRKKLMYRLLSKVTRIDASRLRDKRLNDDEIAYVRNAMAAMRGHTSLIFDDAADMTVEGIRAKLLRHKPDVAFIDHIGLILGSDTRQSEYDRLSEATRQLKLMAKQMNIVIVELCQLNRAVAKNGARFASTADLRGSGTIEQDANCILFVQNNPTGAEELHGADSYRDTGVLIAKNRDGALGLLEMRWQPQYHDWQPREPSEKDLEQMDPFPGGAV